MQSISFTKLYSQDRVFNDVQESVDKLVKALNTSKIIFGVLKKDVILTTGSDNFVNHGLNRVPQGYLVTDRNANAVIYTSATVNSLTDRQIILNCSANVTVDFWFF